MSAPTDWKKLTVSLLEAPIEDISFHGPLDKTHGLDDLDRRLVTSERHQAVLKKAFRLYDTPIRIYYVNLPGRRKYMELGLRDDRWISEFISPEIADITMKYPDDAHVIFTNNSGAARFPMTPWIVVHRMGHAIAADRDGAGRVLMERFLEELIERTNYAIQCAYGKDLPHRLKLFGGWNSSGWFFSESERVFFAFWKATGGFRSARMSSDKEAKPRHKVRQTFEIVYELMAQKIISGKITMRDLPPVINIAQEGGRGFPSKLKLTTNAIDLNEAQLAIESFDGIVENMVDRIIDQMRGKAYVM